MTVALRILKHLREENVCAWPHYVAFDDLNPSRHVYYPLPVVILEQNNVLHDERILWRKDKRETIVMNVRLTEPMFRYTISEINVAMECNIQST